jgi:signal peptidase
LDEEAAAIVADLGKVMHLGPGEGGRELCVAVCGESDESDRSDAEVGRAVVCRLTAPTDRETQVLQMERIAYTITREALSQGGLLLHGALAEYHGSGFMMVGPSKIGKSTASRRLPSPWLSLCDDMTLVVRDGNGRIWAHPWPTWSLFKGGGPGGSWAVERAVSLQAIFFLDQSPSDQLGSVNATQATALVLESAVNLVRREHIPTEENAGRTLFSEGIRAARALALTVPAYSLKLSLDGRFWEEIERALPVGPLPGAGEDSAGRAPVSVESLMPRDSLRLVCTGPSMNPTLQETDFLEVKPYGTGRVRPGDVVCFKSPEMDKTVVHRVVSVGRRVTGDGRPADGIRTRGDNNPADDPWVLQAGDIIGRVEAAQRGARRCVVYGGWRGPMVLRCARLGRGIRKYAGPIPHMLYVFVAGLGPLVRLLPAGLRPRLVRFDARYRVFLKLLSGRQTVGQYDDRLQRWHIRRPFRLFVDEQTLPNPKPDTQSPKPE